MHGWDESSLHFIGKHVGGPSLLDFRVDGLDRIESAANNDDLGIEYINHDCGGSGESIEPAVDQLTCLRRGGYFGCR